MSFFGIFDNLCTIPTVSVKVYFFNIFCVCFLILSLMVLLTGIVKNQESRIEAVKIVWEVGDVKEVINEIEIGDKPTIKEYANDVWITAQIKALAAKDIGLRSISYNIETIRGRVFLAGITSRPEQLETLIKITKSIKGVKEVVNYVVVKE